MEVALVACADDVVTLDDGSFEVLTTEETLVDVKEAMVAAGQEPAHSEVTMRASTEVAMDAEKGEKLLKLLDALVELDDGQYFYHNADIPPEAYT